MMDPIAAVQGTFISSKEILKKTGISRATLNNYIKLGILPRPTVQRPWEHATGAKKIGYFPHRALDQIQMVQRLKREGKSMEAIAAMLREKEQGEGALEKSSQAFPTRNGGMGRAEKPSQLTAKELRLTLGEVSYPAYLLNYDFEVLWINREAETKLFKDSISLESGLAKNIFKLLFNWEFHAHVANWKDLIFLHMSFAKIKLMKTWIARLYSGISESEISILEDIYDRSGQLSRETISESHITLLLKDGLGEPFKVITVFFKEGMLFVYIPMNYLCFVEKGQ